MPSASLALWISHILWHLEAPSTAARRIARARFRDVDNEAEEESLTSLEKNAPFRIVVFVFGALPQAIKLFASRGIPWLKALGAAYLGSWTVLEVLIWFAAAYDRRRPNTGVNTAAHHASVTQLKWKRLREAWATCAIIAHVALLGASTSSLLYQHPVGLVYFALQIGGALSVWRIFLDANDGSNKDGRIIFGAATYFIAFSSFGVVDYIGSDKASVRVWIFTGLFYGSTFINLILCVMPQNARKWVLSKLRPRKDLNLSFSVALILNVYTLSIFFAWKYTAQGTSIPDWTRWFG
jgi:hypothetical protein